MSASTGDVLNGPQAAETTAAMTDFPAIPAAEKPAAPAMGEWHVRKRSKVPPPVDRGAIGPPIPIEDPPAPEEDLDDLDETVSKQLDVVKGFFTESASWTEIEPPKQVKLLIRLGHVIDRTCIDHMIMKAALTQIIAEKEDDRSKRHALTRIDNVLDHAKIAVCKTRRAHGLHSSIELFCWCGTTLDWPFKMVGTSGMASSSSSSGGKHVVRCRGYYCAIGCGANGNSNSECQQHSVVFHEAMCGSCYTRWVLDYSSDDFLGSQNRRYTKKFDPWLNKHCPNISCTRGNHPTGVPFTRAQVFPDNGRGDQMVPITLR